MGRYIVQRFAQQRAMITIITRNPHKANFLKTMGNVGQITPVYGDLNIISTCSLYLQNADVIVNCSGILNSSSENTFSTIHHKGPEALAKTAAMNHVQRFIHISSIAANLASDSEYAATKAQGEEAIMREFPDATIIRPSLIFGKEDNFFNRFAAMSTISPVLPMVGAGETKMQPIYVGDIADAITICVNREKSKGKIYEFGGPQVYTLKELMKKVLQFCHRYRMVLPLPISSAKLIAKLTFWMSEPPITEDQIKLLAYDNIVTAPPERQIQALDIMPKTIESIVPTYLKRFQQKSYSKLISE